MADSETIGSRRSAIAPTQEMFDLYDQYCHNDIDRRTFMDRLGKLAVGGVTVAMLAEALLPRNMRARCSWPRTTAGSGASGSPTTRPMARASRASRWAAILCARRSLPRQKLPAVVVVHENRGLNPHIADVARRTAAAGFIAFAPDALYPLGGYPGTDDEGRTMQATRNGAEMLEDFIAAVQLMQAHPDSHRQGRHCRLLLWRRHLQQRGGARADAGGVSALLWRRGRSWRMSRRSRRRC